MSEGGRWLLVILVAFLLLLDVLWEGLKWWRNRE